MRSRTLALAALLVTAPGCFTSRLSGATESHPNYVKRAIEGVALVASRVHILARDVGSERVVHYAPSSTGSFVPVDGPLPSSDTRFVVARWDANPKTPDLLSVGDPIRHIAADGTLAANTHATEEDLDGVVVAFTGVDERFVVAFGTRASVLAPVLGRGRTTPSFVLEGVARVLSASIALRGARLVPQVVVLKKDDTICMLESGDLATLVPADPKAVLGPPQVNLIVVPDLERLKVGQSVRYVPHGGAILERQWGLTNREVARDVFLEVGRDEQTQRPRLRWRMPSTVSLGGGHSEVGLETRSETSIRQVFAVIAFVGLVPFTVALDIATFPIQVVVAISVGFKDAFKYYH